ncbi:ketol-acid reductoisomerase [Candidatus Roizmanbacteria bacterium RIFCSPLOWO2_12_FULL_40_12]|nr:MAG: ketol-acid reductoisomerase [Candidatus Roizmanbacteria bacterium RIFCSPHIGHO2_12_41_18]OGK58936.1 MAG: ketol-acid reductoisomerase [Candidatus Roizmanbacteria bacterium RIFCSPLOWO2_02_FULL_40_13]OGK60460.1 MAG: ketol-acid reductoisomerase [Candidatus Roizmanbacteria bacterium RIFCSPLOWO2_12_FULL_40_12]
MADRREPRRGAGPIGTEFDFGGVKERIVTRDDFPLERARQVLKGQTVAMVGYGVQGPGQGLNLRDNGIDVIVGQRKFRENGKPSESYEKAVVDGWVPGETLFEPVEAVRRANQVQLLLSDAGQKTTWQEVERALEPGMSLVFSHGFSIVFKDQTGVIPPPFVDVFLVAPKGTGRGVRENYLNGSGINSSFAIFQDATGKAEEHALATGIAIGSGFLFPTTFEKEVYSDLTGERGVLMGAFYGIMQAHFDFLRKDGRSPEQSFTDTVEIATQTISKIMGARGIDGLVKELYETHNFQAFADAYVVGRESTAPLFRDLYDRVVKGIETGIVLEANSQPDYRQKLNDELTKIDQSELGIAGHRVRNKRGEGPTVPSKARDLNIYQAVTAGLLAGVCEAQYNLLRSKGHSPSEAFNETIEEATESLHPLIDREGIDFLYANCSTTAQRGALDWYGTFRDAVAAPMQRIYYGKPLANPAQVRRVILSHEMWKAGKQVRDLRPQNQKVA